MNRSILASAAVAHVRRLSDPYGPIGAPTTVGAAATAMSANSSSSAVHGKMAVASASTTTGGVRGVQSCPQLSTADSSLTTQPSGSRPEPHTSSFTASNSTTASAAAMQQRDPPIDETNPTATSTTGTVDHHGDMGPESGNATLATAEATNPAAVS